MSKFDTNGPTLKNPGGRSKKKKFVTKPSQGVGGTLSFSKFNLQMDFKGRGTFGREVRRADPR